MTPPTIRMRTLEKMAEQYDAIAHKPSAVEFIKFVCEERPTSRKFSTYEMSYIISHWPVRSIAMIARALGRHRESVSKYAKGIGLPAKIKGVPKNFDRFRDGWHAARTATRTP